MQINLRKLISPPVFEDEDQNRVARFLHIVILTAEASAILYAILALASPLLLARLPIVFTGILFFGILYALTRRGLVGLASNLFIGGSWALLTISALVDSGIPAPAFAGYILVIISASLFSGGRAGLLAAVVCVLSGAGILYVQSQDLLTPFFHTPLTSYIVQSTVFFVAGTMLAFFNSDLKNALRASRRAHESLRASEERYRLITENAEDIIWTTNMDLQVTYVSPSLERALGYSAEEIKALPPERLLTPESFASGLKVFGEEVAAVRSQPDPAYARALDLEYRRKNGSTFWIEMKFSFFRDETGRPTGVLGVGRDVTQRKQAEEAIQQSEAKYRALAEQVPVVIYSDLAYGSGRTIYISSHVQEMLGYSPEDWIAQPDLCNDIIHPDDRERMWRETEALAPSGRFTCDYRYIAKDGHIVWVRDTATLLKNEAGEPYLWQGVLLDITAQKQAQEALVQFRQVMDESNDAIFLIDPETSRYIDFNQRALDYLGYSRAELAQMGVIDIAPRVRDMEFWRERVRTINEMGGLVFETVYRRKNGTAFPVEASVRVIEHGGGKIQVAMVRDISERQRTEAVQSAIFEIAAAAQSLETLDTLFAFIHKTLGTLMPVENFYIALYDAQRDLLSFPYYVDQYDEAPAPEKPGKGLTEYVLRTKRPLMATPEVFEALRKGNEIEEVGTKPVDWLGAPLMIGDETFGVMVAQTYNNEARLTRKEMELLTIVALQAATAIKRKQDEEKLRQAEIKYRNLVERLPVVVYTSELGAQGRWLYVSPQIEALLGFTPGEWTADPGLWYRRVHPEDRDRQEELEEQAWAKGEAFDSEYRIFRRDGREIWVRDTAQILPAQSGGTPIVQGTLMDVTERKHAEERVQMERDRLVNILESMTDAFVSLDKNWRYTYMNQRAGEIFGRNPKDLIGKHIWTEFPEGIGQPFHLNYEKVMKEQVSIQFEEYYPPYDKWFENRIYPSKDGLSIFFQDVTERKHAEAILRESQKRLQLFFSQSLDGFFFSMLGEPKEWNDAVDKEAILDYVLLHQRVTEVNNAMLAQYGSTREKFLGRTASDFFAHDLAQARAFRRKLFDAGHTHIETEERRDDGAPIWIEGDYVCMYDGEGRITGMFGIQRDITERKRAEERIKTQLERLASLRAIDTAIASSADLQMTFYILLTQAMTRLRVDAAAILLFDPVTNTFGYGDSQGFRTHGIRKARVRMGEGIAGRAAYERAPLEGHFRSLDEFPHLAGERFTCFLAIPLISKGKIKGVLEIFEREHRNHDRDWVDFFNSLAGQAVIAIENSTLFNDLQRSNLNLRHAYEATLEGWSRALDLRDRETEGHTQRVTGLTERIAIAMGIGGEELLNIRRGALLHDIGKMGVPDRVLHKRGPLTKKEWEAMRKHPLFAFELLTPIAYLRHAVDIPYCHHEKWDGSGYPRGLKREQIPLAARIFAIADVYDALTSDRPYRSGWSKEQTLEHIRAQSDAHFDPRVVESFLKIMQAEAVNAN